MKNHYEEKTIFLPANNAGVQRFSSDLDFCGPPRRFIEFNILAVIENDNRSNDERWNDKSLRPFKVAATLSKSYTFFKDHLPHVAQGFGDSFIRSVPESAGSEIIINGKKYILYKNDADEISYVEFEIDCTSAQEARLRFHAGLAPVLNFMSYKANVPIFIQAVRTEDMKNQTLVLNHVSPYRDVILDNSDGEIHAELLEVYATYREAVNSNSEFYRFLSLYKIMEGIYKIVLPDIIKKAKQQNIDLGFLQKKVPDDEHLFEDQKQYVGKSINEFFNSILTSEFRHGIAHFAMDDGSTVNVGSIEQIEKYSRICYITNICLRIMIANCEAVLEKLRERNSRAAASF